MNTSTDSVQNTDVDNSINSVTVHIHDGNNEPDKRLISQEVYTGYYLLEDYRKEAQALSISHDKTARFYEDLSKYLNYPVILLSAAASVVAGLNTKEKEQFHPYILLVMTLLTLVLTSFDHTVSPKNKVHDHLVAKIEFEEMAENVKQFIQSNHRSHEEIKEYSAEILSYLQKWKSVSPTIPNRYRQL